LPPLFDWRTGYVQGELTGFMATFVPFYRFARHALVQQAAAFTEGFVKPDVQRAIAGQTMLGRARDMQNMFVDTPAWINEAYNEQGDESAMDRLARRALPDYTIGRPSFSTTSTPFMSSFYQKYGYKNPDNIAWMMPALTPIQMGELFATPVVMGMMGIAAATNPNLVLDGSSTLARTLKLPSTFMGEISREMYESTVAKMTGEQNYQSDMVTLTPGEAQLYNGAGRLAGKFSYFWPGTSDNGLGLGFSTTIAKNGEGSRDKVSWGAAMTMRMIPWIGSALPRYFQYRLLLEHGIDTGHAAESAALVFGRAVGAVSHSPYDFEGDMERQYRSDTMEVRDRFESAENAGGSAEIRLRGGERGSVPNLWGRRSRRGD
jgi:hypothetical protein